MATIVGTAAGETLFGTPGNDTVIGKGGDDAALMDAGNDVFEWNPGDGNDIVEGQAGIDTLRFNGSGAIENFDISANGARLRLIRDVGNVIMDLNDVERIDLHAVGGSDNIVVNDLAGTDATRVTINLAATLTGIAPDAKIDSVTVNGTGGDDGIKIASVGSKIVTSGLSAEVIVDHADKTDLLTVNGLGGADTIDASGLAAGRISLQINGGLGADVIIGSAGNDMVTGGDGDDLALLGAGNDRFVWNPGDDNDTVEGQAGTDTLEFHGTNIAENIDISANGGRARFFRDIANITMDLNDVERIEFVALGGADSIVVNDLSGTDVKLVAIDLAAAGGGGDAQPDTVIENGTNANDKISVALLGGAVSVTGLSAQLTIANAEAANDRLTINGLGGNDTVNATKLPAGSLQLVIDGGDGNDSITGSQGNDILLGGAGNDLFQWAPGGGSDTIEGQDGTDTLRFTGSGADEIIDISANGGRVLLSRDVTKITTDLDLDDVERIEVRALGGKDTVTINDLTGTDVTVVTVDLAATSGGAAPDTTLDNVNVNGTAGDDLVLVASTGGKIAVTGLQAEVTVTHADKTDALAIIGGAGNDVIDATGLAIGKIDLHISGGIGNDIMIGSAGNDTVNGDQGDDIALLGAGNDVFVWNPGNGSDTVEGQAGTDTLRFIASGANEVIDVSANGGRARFFRNVGNITTDLNDVERIEFAGLGGADTIVVNDLSGTDVKLVAIDLAAIGGAGDGAADAVIVNGTGGNDKINVALAAGAVSVTGLAAPVTIGGAEFANDSLFINGLGGDDTINASKVPTGILRLTLDGGVGDDTITGNSDGNILLGGDGNDTIAGGLGDDVAFLGVGNDVFVWNPGDGSDVIEGQADTDTLRFTGANADEFIDIAANGGRVRLIRDIGNVALDIDDVERLEVRALGGADTVTVNDLTGTDVTQVLVDLAAVAGGKVPDAKIDKVNVNGTNGDDVITLATVAGEIVVTGLSAQVVIDHAGKTDLLTINGFGGDDVINASSFGANQIALQILGGLGADIVLGSAGNDTVNGGDGDDTALLGAGNDRFIWNPGDDNDTIEGQSGTDTLEFHGANIAENIDIAANGGRVLFFRDVANVVMDMNDVERIEFAALGGSDNIFLHDLAGTDLNLVAVDLGKAGGGGDGQLDRIVDDATTGNDIINVALSAGAVSVTGLAAQLTIANAEIANDILTINGLGGDDKISAAALPAATLQLTLNGGSGNDTITGNAGNNLLIGGADNDTLNGGAGNDTLHGEDGKDSLNGGVGNDTITGGAGDDTITVSSGNDAVRYTSVLDGHDLLVGFDGNAASGQDTLDLDALFDSLFVAQVDRAARVSIIDNGATVEIAVDTDGNASFDLAIATLKTADVITVGQDLLLGS